MLMDEAIERSILRPSSSKARAKYLRHETGPEILGLIADITGLCGGIWACWEFLRKRASSRGSHKASAYLFNKAKFMSLEVRFMNSEGELVEKRVALVALPDELDQQKLNQSVQRILDKRTGK
jgi:hypothetical protein